MEKTTYYISDLFTVPTPKATGPRRDYRRKLRNRKILWALLPYVLQGLFFIAATAIIMGSFTMLAYGLGG